MSNCPTSNCSGLCYAFENIVVNHTHRFNSFVNDNNKAISSELPDSKYNSQKSSSRKVKDDLTEIIFVHTRSVFIVTRHHNILNSIYWFYKTIPHSRNTFGFCPLFSRPLLSLSFLFQVFVSSFMSLIIFSVVISESLPTKMVAEFFSL
jgi:hypothetical protein